jgi:flagellar biosynthesis/type III secretory pathway protein FliH
LVGIGYAQGLAESKAEGFAEGRAEGERTILTRMLTRRFGPLPEWAKAHLADADSDDLEQWAIQALDAQRLKDVFEA